MKCINNSLKTVHTNITLTHFKFCKTHQSLARNQKLFLKSRSQRVNTTISLRNIITIKHILIECGDLVEYRKKYVYCVVETLWLVLND